MNVFALLAFAGVFLSGFSNGLYLYTRKTLPKGRRYPISESRLAQTNAEEDIPPETVSEINLGNDEGSAAEFNTLDGSSLFLPITEGLNSLDDLVNNNEFVENQAVVGYAPSPNVPFRVQVKARNSIPDSELSNVPNSEVRKADDPKGDAGTLTPGQNSDSPEGTLVADASVPIPDTALVSPLTVTGSSGQDKTQELGSQDLTGADPGLIASTVGVGLQGQDIPLEPEGNSDPVNNGLLLGNGDNDQTLTLAFADPALSSGKSGTQLTDPLFANPSLSSGLLPPGSIFASAAGAGDSLFVDAVSDFAPLPPNGASTQASLFSPDDSAPGADSNEDPNNQDESFLRNSDQIDWSDPCNLMHGSDRPFSACTLTTSRTVLAPFKIPTVPRPDSDIAVDVIADIP